MIKKDRKKERKKGYLPVNVGLTIKKKTKKQ